MSQYLRKIEEAQARAHALEEQLGDLEIATNASRSAPLARELSQLRPLTTAGERYHRADRARAEAKELLADPDPDVAQLARSELKDLEGEIAEIEAEIRRLLVPADPNDERNAMLELRAGAGGEEAALFAGDLLRMYTRYAELRGWKFEILTLSESGTGGIREAIAAVSGPRVFSRLKHERGVHRVQRVPETEAQGRIHTSTVTVAVLPEAREVEVNIDPRELRIDVMRASGPGGQSVNTTDSAVRITHLPSGLTVQCQDEKSQHKNRVRALKILRARLLEQERQRAAQERADERRSQVGSAGRSERIRTYNFPQSRVTDHRVGLTLHQLDRILEGELEPLLDAVHLGLARDEPPASPPLPPPQRTSPGRASGGSSTCCVGPPATSPARGSKPRVWTPNACWPTPSTAIACVSIWTTTSPSENPNGGAFAHWSAPAPASADRWRYSPGSANSGRCRCGSAQVSLCPDPRPKEWSRRPSPCSPRPTAGPACSKSARARGPSPWPWPGSDPSFNSPPPISAPPPWLPPRTTPNSWASPTASSGARASSSPPWRSGASTWWSATPPTSPAGTLTRSPPSSPTNPRERSSAVKTAASSAAACWRRRRPFSTRVALW